MSMFRSSRFHRLQAVLSNLPIVRPLNPPVKVKLTKNQLKALRRKEAK